MLLLTFAWSAPTPSLSNSAAPITFTLAPPDGWVFGSGVPDVETTYVAMSPDGSQVAFVAIERGGTSAVWLRQLAALQPRRLSGTDGAISVFWSPDSRSLAFFARDKLNRLDLPDGPPVPIADVSTRIGLTGTWGRERILFAFRLPAASRQPPRRGRRREASSGCAGRAFCQTVSARCTSPGRPTAPAICGFSNPPAHRAPSCA
jgi:hypothetical protein